MRSHPYRTLPPKEVAPAARGADPSDFVLLVAMSTFCSMPIVGSMLSDGRLGTEGSFALLILCGVLRVAYGELRGARRSRGTRELSPGE